MTMRAADSMPDLPKPSKYDEWAGSPAYYTADQMHQYARDYAAAALSQTAGVARYADGVRAAAAWLDGVRNEFCEEHGRIESDTNALTFGRGKHAEAKEEYVSTLEDLAAGIRNMLAAAPAASGGESWRCFYCDEVFTDRESAHLHFGAGNFLDQKTPGCQIDIAAYRAMEETVRRYQEEDADIHRSMHRMAGEHALALRREEEKGYARGLRDAENEPNFPARASVSERARAIEMLAQEVEKDMTACADDIRAGKLHGMADASVRAIIRAMGEQALTQQRGIGVGVDVTGDGAHVTVRDGATIVYSELHPLTTPKQCGSPEPVAWQYRCTDQRDGVSLWVDIDADYVDLVRGKDGIDVRALYTTPQPGAEALRELAKNILNWQPLTSINKADRLYQILMDAGIPFESVTDELESLLARGAE